MGHATIADLADCPSATQRADPIEILRAQSHSRVVDLVPVRNQRMVATPFTFYRGAAAVMASDLAALPDSGVLTQICGDAHLSNFGVYYTPERRMIFDVNDFDEAAPGPFEWDVKRLAASVVIAGRGNGFDADTTREHARAVAKAYRKRMLASASADTLDCWYARLDVADLIDTIGSKLDTSSADRTIRALRKAQHRNSSQAVTKLCESTDQGLRIRSDPPLLVPVTELMGRARGADVVESIVGAIDEYKARASGHVRVLIDQFEIVDVARKVVGVGSVGTRTWIVLLHGHVDDPLFLQVKEAQQSVIAQHVSGPAYPNEGRRVVEGQLLMQAASDIFLGWTTATDADGVRRDFYVRQLRDGKGSIVIEALDAPDLKLYGKFCARALAHAHARTASRTAIAEYLSSGKGFASAIADYAVAYADLNENDHASMVAAVADGRMPVADLK